MWNLVDSASNIKSAANGNKQNSFKRYTGSSF